jgi:hypothetical protein
MAVFRVEKTKDFTVMSNHHLRNTALSLKAKGLMSLMLSLPEFWDYTTRGLARICKDGVDAISTTLNELEKNGYLTRERLRDDHGRLGDIEYTIHEKPIQPESTAAEPFPPKRDFPDQVKPDQVNPDVEEPDVDGPDQVFPAQLNTKESRTHGSIPKKSNTHESNIHPSIDPVGEAPLSSRRDRPDWMDRMDEIESCRELIMRNIEYDCLCDPYGAERMDEVVELMLETILSKRDYIRVAGDEYPREVVKSHLLKVTASHLEYVFDCLDKSAAKIRNIKAYLITALYNAPATMDSYYRAEVNNDLYGGGL